MNLYLVRHSDAERTASGKRDEERSLLKEGRERIKTAAKGWLYIINKIDLICTSPYLRALETAEIIAETFDYEKEIIKDKSLMAGCFTKDLITFVNSLDGENIMVVGHQPDLSEHVSNLISSNGALVEFKKAAIAKISFNGKLNQAKGYLEYLIPSDAFVQ